MKIICDSRSTLAFTFEGEQVELDEHGVGEISDAKGKALLAENKHFKKATDALVKKAKEEEEEEEVAAEKAEAEAEAEAAEPEEGADS